MHSHEARHARSSSVVSASPSVPVRQAVAASGAPSGGGATSEVVDIAVNPWVGYEANAGVVGHLLEEKLGFTVEYKDLAEQVSWEGFEIRRGRRHRRELGPRRPHPDLRHRQGRRGRRREHRHRRDHRLVRAAVDGDRSIPTSPTGPTSTSYAELFKTSESGDKGQFLDGDPSFVTSDEGIINGLGLDYEVVYAGSEAALIEAFRKAEQNKTPLLGYFYSPQWFLNEVPLVKIDLPPWTEGCDADPGEDHLRLRAVHPLDKYHQQEPRGQGADGGPAHQELHVDGRADQNTVANYITNDGHVPRGGRQEVGRRERGQVAGLDAAPDRRRLSDRNMAATGNARRRGFSASEECRVGQGTARRDHRCRHRRLLASPTSSSCAAGRTSSVIDQGPPLRGRRLDDRMRPGSSSRPTARRPWPSSPGTRSRSRASLELDGRVVLQPGRQPRVRPDRRPAPGAAPAAPASPSRGASTAG